MTMLRPIKTIEDKDLKWIVNNIRPEHIKACFQLNSEKFHRMKPGFRLQSLSNQDLTNLLQNNLHDSFVSGFITFEAGIWAQRCMNLYRKIKKLYDNVLSMTIAINLSKFKDNPRAMFYFVEDKALVEKQDVIVQMLPYISQLNQIRNTKRKQNQDRIKRIKQIKLDYQTTKEKYNELENNYKKLFHEKKNNQIETSQTSDKLRKRLADNPIRFVNHYPNGIFSVVRQLWRTEDNQDKKVSRCLDIDIENKILITRRVKEEDEKSFSNRTTIITNTIAEKAKDYLYVVNWQTKPNYSNPSRDYVEAEAIDGIQPIEVIVLDECRNMDDVIKTIKKGIRIIPSNCKWLITYQTEQDERKAILLTDKESSNDDGICKIDESVYVLPEYQISLEECIKEERELGNRIFYKKLFLGEPEELVPLYGDREIVRKVLIDISKQRIFRERGFTKNQWRKYIDVLESVPVTNVYQSIAENCGCTIEQAQKLVNDFIKASNQYIGYEDIDSQVFKTIIENDSNLLQQASHLLENQWKESNDKRISEVKQKIEKMNSDLLQKSQKVVALKNEYNSLKNKKEELVDYVKNKKELVNKVDTKLKTKLREIQEDTSETLAKMMFDYGLVNKNTNIANENTKKSINFISQSIDKADFGKELVNYRDMYHLLRLNLVAAGIANKYASEVACFFYACLQQHESITLAGVNSIAIANAIGVSAFGEVPILVDLQSPYQSTELTQIKNLSNRVIIIRNAFSSDWLGHIDELVSLEDKRVIFSVPFFDDLSILPKNVMVYTIPIITDMLVDKIAGKTFTFGKFATNYQHVDENIEVEEQEQLQGLNLPIFLKNRYDKLFSVAGQIKTGTNFINSQFICVAVPYAYISGQLQHVMANFDDEKIPDELKEEFRAVFGVIEDD